MGKLKKNNIISQNKGEIIILNFQKLESLAEIENNSTEEISTI
jgi:hypothetical protein